MVLLEDKIKFIEFLLEKYDFKKTGCRYLFGYILNNKEVLKNVCFVDDAHYCKRSMVISTKDFSGGVPFRFYKGDLMTADENKALNELRTNNGIMYIQINFTNKESSPYYVLVHEENTFIPEHIRSVVPYEDRKLTEELVSHLTEKMNTNFYNKEIDECLDRGDKEKFMELTTQLLDWGYEGVGK
jgi:uncharacterized protein YpiB (UPF0302 family)